MRITSYGRERKRLLNRGYLGRNRCDGQSYFDLSADGQSQAGQLLLGHTKIESTVRYLGIELDDALAIAERVDE